MNDMLDTRLPYGLLSVGLFLDMPDTGKRNAMVMVVDQFTKRMTMIPGRNYWTLI
ncbi:uncharacterized protein BJX67DRAFT_260879 [Aspergillus lucknowensis]|uniref:Integrase catalytic domain-containing protein n=1 Tax=Aspergillus lucknowensis TaxID=176173 RepID=A0ABR4LG63_9EURO